MTKNKTSLTDSSLGNCDDFNNNACPQKISFFKRAQQISSDIWNDHDLWIGALAVKGGATAMVIGGVVGVSYAITLPFILPVIGVTLCGGLIGVGVYGVAAGARGTWKAIKRKFGGKVETPEERAKRRRERIKKRENSFFAKIAKKPLVKKILDTHTFKTVKKITEKQNKLFLAGIAGTGSAFWFVSSAITLATQIVLLPVIAVSTLVTFGTVAAASLMLSGAYGLYISAKPFFKSFKDKKEKEQNKPEIPANKTHEKKIVPVNLPNKSQGYTIGINSATIHSLPKASPKFKKANKNCHKKPVKGRFRQKSQLLREKELELI